MFECLSKMILGKFFQIGSQSDRIVCCLQADFHYVHYFDYKINNSNNNNNNNNNSLIVHSKFY